MRQYRKNNIIRLPDGGWCIEKNLCLVVLCHLLINLDYIYYYESLLLEIDQEEKR